MPSDKPLIALRLDPELYALVCAAARAETRTPANYVAHQLRVVLTNAIPGIRDAVRYSGREFNLKDQIAVKRAPAKSIKHK